MNSTTDMQSEHSDDDYSDDTLKIVIESPSKRKKFVPNESDKQIIEEVEEYIEDSLEEKASKINLKAKDVKSILKHVVTNEHVLALVRQAEHPEEVDESILVYEPKLTRAKVKSLPNVPNPLLVSPNVKKKSETHVLISGDLPEDSSDDEYVPGEEESEDDRDSSVLSESDPLSVPPMTPPTPLSQDLLETSYTDDGVFKIPLTKTTSEVADATIALRTRSKLCLSSTPLEIIEEKFIPPDITTDMYDMDCDDDDWRDFLKKFTRPLDEITRAAEDEEHDPEYNILADEEIDEVDKEELRMDKAVKVSRKELNDLMSELFAYADDIFSRNDKENSVMNISTPVPDLDPSLPECPQESLKQNLEEQDEVDSEPVMIEKDQIPLLEQQLRQHVQLLTQNFLLTYCHPEIHEFSSKCKEYLLNLKYLGDGKERSMFHVYNLPGALELVENWTNKWYSNSPEIKQLKSHVEGDIAESIKKKNVGTQYISTLAPLIMETISNSDVFIYTSLLPKVPYKSKTVYSSKHITFCDAEDSLIALGIEQFSSFPPENKGNGNQKSSEITLLGIAKLISEHIMPTKTAKQVFTRIKSCRLSRCASNPIKTYYQTKKIAPLIHYVYPLDTMKVIPPCQRNPDDLPYQIKTYLQTQKQKTGIMTENVTVPAITLTPIVSFVEPQPVITNRNILPQPQKYIRLNQNIFNPTNSVITSTPVKQSARTTQPIRYKAKKITRVRNVATQETRTSKPATPLEIIIKIFKKPSRAEKILELFQSTNGLVDLTEQVADMLPSMPNLNTPIKRDPHEKAHDQPGPSHNQNVLKNLVQDLSIQSTSNEDHSQEVVEVESKIDVSEVTLTGAGPADNSTVNNVKAEKDNLDDINALMVASSTVKPNTKKEPSGAEKKRAKTRREFLANLAICTPEDPEITTQKSERFAMAYYDKLRETLELNDYHQIMHILNEFEGVDTIDLYYKVEGVLRPKYNELAEEFLLFLKEKEAAAVGKLIPWIQMNTRSKFLKKMEIYFKDQPAQLRKIFKCLTELSETMDVTMDKVKTTLIPMLKGNTQLVDLFLQNFLNETPPKSLMEGCYEIIDVNKEMARPENEEHYESIVIPTEDDVYGSSSCVCSCHQIEDPEFKTRHRHCIPCGTKFIQGKVYIQTGRGLRPATVSFLTNSNKDHNVRLNGKSSTNSRRKRSETSPSKQVFVSPSKDNGDEESEDEVDGKKKVKTKTPRKRKKQPDKKSAKEPAKSGKASEKTEKPVKKRLISKKSSKEVKNCVENAQPNEQEDVKPNIEPETKPGANPGQLKRLSDENAEWDYGVSTESVELKTSPQTAESESEFCEESSQDNCESDSNLSCSSGSNTQSDVGEELNWRRDEDKIILETFQKENDKEHAFTLIANKLKDRSVSQIRSRFQTLMTLLMEQLE